MLAEGLAALALAPGDNAICGPQKGGCGLAKALLSAITRPPGALQLALNTR